jgi:transposase-like protein
MRIYCPNCRRTNRIKKPIKGVTRFQCLCGRYFSIDSDGIILNEDEMRLLEILPKQKQGYGVQQ